MAVKILCCGDIHLGWSPTRIPPEQADLARFSPAAALQKSVALAKQLQVHAVVFAGDLVDEQNALFESHAALTTCLEELRDAGIRALAVTGNHDFAVLPLIAERIPEFRVLARGDEWDEEIIAEHGRPLVRIQGRSMTAQHCPDNPLLNYPQPTDDLPTIALLHCDVDSSAQQYFPVTLQELKLKAPSAWLLGHIHKPQRLQEQPLILYPGSLQGLDPGEQGPHGPWLIEIDQAHTAQATQFPLAALRYEQITITLDQMERADELAPRILDALTAWDQANADAVGEVELLACRLVLSGKTAAHHALPLAAEALRAEQPLLNERYFIEKIVIETQPLENLGTIAQHQDPAGLLAQKLLLLQERCPPEPYAQLLQQARADLQAVWHDPAYLPLIESGPPSDDEMRELLLRTGTLLLDSLLEQRRSRV